MSTRRVSTTERRSALSAGLVLLAVLVLGSATSIAAPIPVPVMILSVALATAGAVAIVAAWTGRSWGRWLGVGASLMTALAAAPGAVVASGPLQYVAGATVAIAIPCAVLLLLPSSGRAALAQGEV